MLCRDIDGSVAYWASSLLVILARLVPRWWLAGEVNAATLLALAIGHLAMHLSQRRHSSYKTNGHHDRLAEVLSLGCRMAKMVSMDATVRPGAALIKGESSPIRAEGASRANAMDRRK